MAKISGFVYCLNAERITAPDGKGEMTNAVGIVSTIMPEYVPGAFSFSIVFSIIDFDVSSNNTIRIIFGDDLDKKMVDSGEITLNIPVVDTQIDIPDSYKGANLCMDMRNVVFEREGVYTTTVLFNNEEIGRYGIYVKGRNK